jgi:hypothetical protein
MKWRSSRLEFGVGAAARVCSVKKNFARSRVSGGPVRQFQSTPVLRLLHGFHNQNDTMPFSESCDDSRAASWRARTDLCRWRTFRLVHDSNARQEERPMSRQITEEINRAIRSTERTSVEPEPAEVEALAYQLWLERGCPIGSDQDDWYRAEEQLRRDNKAISRRAA